MKWRISNASIETVKNVCRQHDVSHLFYAPLGYEFNERQRDGGKTLPFCHREGFDDSVISGARRVMTATKCDEMYSFTPFKNARLPSAEDIPPCVPAPKIRVSGRFLHPAPISLNYPQQAFDAASVEEEKRGYRAAGRQFCAQGADGMSR